MYDSNGGLFLEPKDTPAQIAYKVHEHNTGIAQNPALAIFDELDAYLIEEQQGVNLQKKEGSKNDKSHLMTSARPAEFVTYALAVSDAINQGDKTYFEREPQYKDALRYFIEKTVTLHGEEKGLAPELYAAQDKTERFFDALRGNDDTQRFRDILKNWYGEAWTQTWLGF